MLCLKIFFFLLEAKSHIGQSDTTSAYFKIYFPSYARWYIPLVPVLGKQRLEDFSVYIANSRIARATPGDPSQKKTFLNLVL